jgi:hypothetical protein
MSTAPTLRACLLLALALFAVLIPGRAPADTATATASAPPAASPATEASPVTATGLLPVFGVAVDLDATGGKPEQAVSSLQKLWDQYLKAAGFNVIQIPVDVRELGDRGAGRLAKLCVWAKSKNVRLAPILVGAPLGQPLPDDYADKVGTFAAKTIELVGKEGDPQAYAQIMLYQVERPLNHPANHGPMDAAKAASMMAKVMDKLRAAEQTGLAGSSLQATPVLADASFDYELIRVGAIAHVAITDEAYQQAYASLHTYLGAVLGAAPVDVIEVEWFPGSYSSEGVERMPDLVGKLQADFPGKLIIVGTGFSTAAGAEADQSRYYTQAFNNLSDLRTNQGVESSLAGILWRTALDRPGGEPPPPSPRTQEAMSSWNWSDKAAEVTRMWNEPGADSKEMTWWLGHVESHFGLLASGKDASKTGEPKMSYQLLARLKTSLAAAAEATGAGDIAKEIEGAGAGKGIGSAVKERLQSALFGMLDALVAKTAESLVSGGGSGGGSDGGAPPPPPTPTPANLANLQINQIGEIPAMPKMGVLTPFPVTIFNAGTAPARNVVLYLREGTSDLASTNPTTLSPGAETTIEVDWTPAHSGNFHDVAFVAYCDNEGDAGNNQAPVGDVPVESSGGDGTGGTGGHRGGLGGLIFNPGALGGIKGSLQTSTSPGFVQISAIRSMTPMSGKTPMALMIGGAPSGGSPGTSMRITTGSPAPGGTSGITPISRTTSTGLEPMSLAFSISNPFSHNFTRVSAALKIDGKLIATRDLGTLLPAQRRTVTFALWTPPHAGTFPVNIDLSGVGPTGRALTSSARDELVVGAPSSPPIATRSLTISGSTPGSTPPGGIATRSLPTTRLITPLMISGGTPLARTFQPRPVYAVRGFGMMGVTLFGLTANSLLLDPFPALIGKDVTMTVRLFNSERTAAHKVKVEGFVDEEKVGETTVDLPIARSVDVKGFKAWKAKPGRHSFRAVVNDGSRQANAIKPIDVRPPGAGIGAGGVAALIGRGGFAGSKLTLGSKLAMASTDIRLNPLVPTVGSDVTISVRVQNVGPTDVQRAHAELFVDGVRLGEDNADIAAGKDAVLSSFPHWKPTAGNHTLLCRASSGSQVVSATRDVSVSATALLVKGLPMATTTFKTGFATLLTAKPDLQILPGDIIFTPSMPRPGTAVTISITVRNVGAAAANGGTVLCILSADGSEVTRSQFPAALAAGGSTTLTWAVTAPSSGSQLAVNATASVADDAQPGNNTATAMASMGLLLIKQPLLQPKLVLPSR